MASTDTQPDTHLDAFFDDGGESSVVSSQLSEGGGAIPFRSQSPTANCQLRAANAAPARASSGPPTTSSEVSLANATWASEAKQRRIVGFINGSTDEPALFEFAGREGQASVVQTGVGDDALE